MAMVVRANKYSSELGGHIASFQSLATLYEVGFNHFWHAPSAEHGGDLVYFQGHSSPGNYARAFLEGRLTEEQLDNFRQEVGGNGLSSYPHPWLMPDFWQFPTVSLGIGAITSIYQARFMKYLNHRSITDTAGRKVWAFLGDGEMDEPETMGAIGLAGREQLDNLIWVVNCNLQRLDGPVRGNGKIIQELESDFRGAGWNVIKVIWGSRWDSLLEADIDGRLVHVMNESVDGEYQTYKSRDGKYVREHFFGKDPVLLDRVAHMSDDEIWQLNRGGLDQQKVYSAYATAVRETRPPDRDPRQDDQGLRHGHLGRGPDDRPPGQEDGRGRAARLPRPLRAAADRRAGARRRVLQAAGGLAGDAVPARASRRARWLAAGSPAHGRGARRFPSSRPSSPSSTAPASARSRPRWRSCACWRRCCVTSRSASGSCRSCPTSRAPSAWRACSARSACTPPSGQLYKPEDSEQLMYYREDQAGQILEEGITEAGSMSSFIAAATSYSAHGEQMIPFYIYYSMFGYQRVGDLVWAAADSRARGFLLGGTAGRTTLNGEGLQHEDGHSHVLFSVVPNVRAYDPTYGYEVAVIIQEGLRRMVAEQEDVFYYLTLMNENYVHPAMPKGAEEGILRGMYLLHVGGYAAGEEAAGAAARLGHDPARGAGRRRAARTGLRRVLADVWSVTSFTELRRDGIEVERWNTLNPLAKKPRTPYVTEQLQKRQGPVIASTDYIRAYADQIRGWVDGSGTGDKARIYRVLGTDGFGRSDYRKALRSFFEVDRHHVVVSALKALADDGVVDVKQVAEAIKRYEIDPSAPMPTTV